MIVVVQMYHMFSVVDLWLKRRINQYFSGATCDVPVGQYRAATYYSLLSGRRAMKRGVL